MRPRRFILPQTGTGGYGIRPYVFCGDGEGHVFPCCVCRGDHWSPVNLPPQRIFRGSFLVRQAGTGEQCSPLQEFSPVWARNIPARPTFLSPTACGRSPLAEGAKRGRCPARRFLPLSETESVGAHSICARGGLSCRKRARADMESAPTFLKRQSTAPAPTKARAGRHRRFAEYGMWVRWSAPGAWRAAFHRQAFARLPARELCWPAAGSTDRCPQAAAQRAKARAREASFFMGDFSYSL